MSAPSAIDAVRGAAGNHEGTTMSVVGTSRTSRDVRLESAKWTKAARLRGDVEGAVPGGVQAVQWSLPGN